MEQEPKIDIEKEAEKEKEKIRRARRAGELIADPLFTEAIAEIKRGAYQLFLSVSANDIEGMRTAKILNRVANSFEDLFLDVITEGSISTSNLEDLLKQTESK
jgi:hypothetical protein